MSIDHPKLKHIVKDYRIIDMPDNDYPQAGNSVGHKRIVREIPEDLSKDLSVLDIGFGMGDLGRIIKEDSDTSHWNVDGIDAYHRTCSNTELFAKKQYRNIWHGFANDLPKDQLSSYDIICLFDVIEHLDPEPAKELLTLLLESLGPNRYLALSTPLFFWPQDQMHEGDHEEHKIAIPPKSLFVLGPIKYHINSRFLIGTFLFSQRSAVQMKYFESYTDQSIDQDAARDQLNRLGARVDDTVRTLA